MAYFVATVHRIGRTQDQIVVDAKSEKKAIEQVYNGLVEDGCSTPDAVTVLKVTKDGARNLINNGHRNWTAL